jgi:nucleotide-binding universal stress UspA family protein
MITLRQILVPTDFSEPSDKAIRYAEAFAQAFGGTTVHFLHVVESTFLQGWTPDGYVGALPEYRERMEREARQALEARVAASELPRSAIRLATRVGHPVVEILRYAKEEAVDLIVLGTHGRSRLGHLLMGSVAERVVRTAPCPVLTVRHPEHEFVVPES